MSTKAWDDLAAALAALGPPSSSSEARLRPTLDALRKVAESEGTGSAYRDYDAQETIERAADD